MPSSTSTVRRIAFDPAVHDDALIDGREHRGVLDGVLDGVLVDDVQPSIGLSVSVAIASSIERSLAGASSDSPVRSDTLAPHMSNVGIGTGINDSSAASRLPPIAVGNGCTRSRAPGSRHGRIDLYRLPPRSRMVALRTESSDGDLITFP
jgi:hypothetical protein